MNLMNFRNLLFVNLLSITCESHPQVVGLIVQKFETETKIVPVPDFMDFIFSLFISLFDEQGIEFWEKNVLQTLAAKTVL